MRRTGEQIYEATYANHYMGITAEQMGGTLRFDMSKKSMDRDEFVIKFWPLLTDTRFN
jgi:nitrogen fixation protein FixH